MPGIVIPDVLAPGINECRKILVGDLAVSLAASGFAHFELRSYCRAFKQCFRVGAGASCSEEHKENTNTKPKNTICLWDAHEAAWFYAATFPDSEVTAVHKAPSDYPGGKEGDVLTDALAAGGGEAKRAFEAMMRMRKIDIATIEAARRG